MFVVLTVVFAGQDTVLDCNKDFDLNSNGKDLVPIVENYYS